MIDKKILNTSVKNALNEAYYKGVEVIPIKVCWEKNGECYYNGIIPFHN